MELTLDFIQYVFFEYNRTIFKTHLTELPTPTFRISNTKGAFGTFRHKRYDRSGYSYQISVSKYFVRNEHEYRMTILHEMIHEYIAFNGIKDNAVHGRKFISIMEDINKTFGTTVNVRGGKYDAVSTKKISHLVYFHNKYDGKEWIVKTNSQSVINYIRHRDCWEHVCEVFTTSPFIDTNMHCCRTPRKIHGLVVTDKIKKEIYDNYVDYSEAKKVA